MQIIKRFVLSQMGVNCFLIEANGKIILVDAPAGIDRVMSYMKEHDLKLDHVLITHTHFDHIVGCEELYQAGLISEVYVSPLEIPLFLDNSNTGNMSGQYGCNITFSGEIKSLYELDNKSLDLEIKYIHGHSKQSAVFVWKQDKIIISGDTLFKESIGRSDFPGGNYKMLRNGILENIMCYEDFRVFPGHGFSTNTEKERDNHLLNT